MILNCGKGTTKSIMMNFSANSIFVIWLNNILFSKVPDVSIASSIVSEALVSCKN